jgi:GrpB-like predicted nucleotidyltransferase (UPF0157 family)
MMNKLVGLLVAVAISLGFKHNSIERKIGHVCLCVALFSFCWKFVWTEQFVCCTVVTVLYGLVVMLWTFYVRYPLFRTYGKVFGVIDCPHLAAFTRTSNRLTLKPFNPRWKAEFLAERLRTRALLLNKWKDIIDEQLCPEGLEHIGSTAIVDIALAKPQHDCALAVTCNTLPAQFYVDLASLGYMYIGVAPHSLDCSDHFFFYAPNVDERQQLGEGFFLHVVTPKVHEWFRTSQAFCRYLSANVVARNSYSDLKRDIAQVERHIGKESTTHIVLNVGLTGVLSHFQAITP